MIPFVIGLLVLAGWAALCFWLAVRRYRARRGVSDLYIVTMITAGACCAIMTFFLIFQAFNPVPASFDRP